MKQIKYVLLFCLLFASKITWAQIAVQTDTFVNIKVYGACEMCKERIEKAAKKKGVKTAEWSSSTNMLKLVYNPQKTTIDEIEDRIVAVGHDAGNKKAKDAIYNALPECCWYRSEDTEAMELPTNLDSISQAITNQSALATLIKGIVVEEDAKENFKPLEKASIFWLGTNSGTTADASGYFAIKPNENTNKLVVSYVGYKSDTLMVKNQYSLKVILASNKQLKSVTVVSRQRSTYINTISAVRMQTITGKELLKAACCNLSESFETNPSVDVSYNDAVTGSKQIQLLGLSGNYSQLTVENLPGPRGIATPLGLNSIAGPWIESIQLTKGVGSVANGFESISGQINVELKKPENSEKLLANIYVNDYGKTDLNLNLSKKIGNKWTAALLLHNNFLNNNTIDFNKDGFRDLPTGNTISLINRYKFDNGKGVMAQFGVKVLSDKRTGGEVDFNAAKDKNTTTNYGLGITTERYEGFAKIGYVFPQKKYKSIGLQISGINHTQNSYFGLTTYNAKQQTIYANLIYQSIINSTIHKFRAGASFVADKYDEKFNATNFYRKEIVPGIFGEYTYTPNEKITAIAGLRIDNNNLYGVFVTPRLNIRYEPIAGTAIRLSAGRGQRTANIFAENISSFVSARQLNISTSNSKGAYGLNAEVAWNKGISLDQKLKLFNRDASLGLDYFRNDFTNQVVVDLEDARAVKFYNLQGKSYSNSLQAELTFEPLAKLEMRLAYRYFDVKNTFSGKLLERPLISKNRAFANLAYTLNGFKFDYTITVNGKKRLPSTKANIPAYQLPEFSPNVVVMHAQVSKTFGKKHPLDFYVGAENIANFFQKNVILASESPFGPYFDASLVWGPINGRMLYAGLRYKIK